MIRFSRRITGKSESIPLCKTIEQNVENTASKLRIAQSHLYRVRVVYSSILGNHDDDDLAFLKMSSSSLSSEEDEVMLTLVDASEDHAGAQQYSWEAAAKEVVPTLFVANVCGIVIALPPILSTLQCTFVELFVSRCPFFAY